MIVGLAPMGMNCKTSLCNNSNYLAWILLLKVPVGIQLQLVSWTLDNQQNYHSDHPIEQELQGFNRVYCLSEP